MWKFDTLDSASKDPEMHATDFRIFFRLIQHSDQRTRVTRISDEKLIREIHRDRKALTKARKRLSELGYLKIQTGKFRVGTIYEFPMTRINNLLDESGMLSDDDDDTINAPKTPHSGTRHIEEKTPHSSNGEKTPRRSRLWGENALHIGEELPPIHLTLSPDSLPVTEESLSAHVREAEAGMAPVGSQRVAQERLYELLGSGSMTRGMIVGARMGNEFYRLAELLAHEGLSASAISSLRAKAA